MELNLLLKYVVFTVLYIEILSFLFNPKIKTQMMMCAVILTAIASVAIPFDFKYLSRITGESNGTKIYSKVSDLCTGTDNVCTSFIRLLPDSIQELNETEPIGWFIGFLGLLNMIGMLFLTIIEYNNDIKLSKRNKRRAVIIKSLFISNVISVFIIGILCYLLFTDDVSFTVFGVTRNWLSKLKSKEALLFVMTYLFGSSAYMLHESRMLYKLRVNKLHAK
jgi:hypothetical protein